MKSAVILSLVVFILTGCQSVWQKDLQANLPLMGHRNWIVVADSAYPFQSAPGIETLYSDSTQIDTLKAVLEEVNKASHIQAKVYADSEMESVVEADAPGIDRYRKALDDVLAAQTVAVMPHEDIIKKLDQSSDLFKIMIIKTDLTIPYTSVFLELDCGYWDADKEARLRKAIKGRASK